MDKVTKQKIKHTLRKNGLTIFLGISVILLIIIALMNVSVKKRRSKKKK